jgi:hypothetical protein
MMFKQVFQCVDCKKTGEIDLSELETVGDMLRWMVQEHKRISPDCRAAPFRFRALFNPGKGETPRSQLEKLSQPEVEQADNAD